MKFKLRYHCLDFVEANKEMYGFDISSKSRLET